MKTLKSPILLFCGIFYFGITSLFVNAQNSWPQRPVKIVVPFAPGGNTDSIARITAERLTQGLGQLFIVENKVGAGGAIAADYVAKSPADGYTLLMAAMPVMAILPIITKTNFDPLKDFVAISNVGSNPFVMGVHKSIPATTIEEFVAYVKKNPGKFNYASGGSGSVSHLSAALFVKRAQIEMAHISYKGGAPAVTDLLGGNVQMYFGNFSELFPHVSGGNIRIIGVSSNSRVAQLPQVATIAESGFPGFKTLTWNGLMAPAETSPAIIARLTEAVVKAVKTESTMAKFIQIGVDPIGNSSKDFSETLRSDIAIWSEAAKAANLKME
ncbi:MAG: tripartite tricarboxylate transporter substrate binding protein [Polynucleobacter sp.]|jgi:tripartite-type tricarboxylate transporter receptor subunit TctC|nr:tripartite tricarboxylate transporter substrate binding protein [Polynucleobacter sp.]